MNAEQGLVKGLIGRIRSSTQLDDRVLAILVFIIIIFVVLQAVLNLSSYYLGFVSSILVFSIFALGYNILHGHTGMISFGHAGFFLVGGYAGSLTLAHLISNVWLGLVIALAASATFAFIVGFSSVRIRGIYFSLLTLAFSMLPFILVRTVLRSWTGGQMGMQFRSPPPFFFDLGNPRFFILFALGALVLVYVITRILLASSFGDRLRGVRDNEIKLEALGYNTRRIKYTAVVISGTLSGFAGYLLLLQAFAISPTMGSYFNSAKVIFVCLIGGVYSIAGPIIGTFFWYIVQEFLVKPGFLEITLGTLLVIVILRFPAGFISLIKR